MSTQATDSGRVSSPASTGGAGTFFEQHVDAALLSWLLVRSIPPILTDCRVCEVHFQTEHLGWHTDDFLLVCETGDGRRRRLAGQVKRSFTVSYADDDFRKAVSDCWKDFRKGDPFSAEEDRCAFVTLRGTNTLLESFCGLLDCARASQDASDFERRLMTQGFVSSKVRQYCDEIRKIVDECEGRAVSLGELWPFLRVLHVLSFDLNTTTGQTEAVIKSLLAHTAHGQDGLGAADATWEALLREVGGGMPTARSYCHDDLPGEVRQRHGTLRGADNQALQALRDHSEPILERIRTTIGSNVHLKRDQLVQSVIDQLGSTQVVLISGPAGSGKSGIAKDAVDVLNADHFIFMFRAEEFATVHLDETLHRSQIPARAVTLGAILAAQHRKVLLVESIERLLEASTRSAFDDLLNLLRKDKSWQVILTCRDYSADLVRSSFLERSGVGHAVLTVPPLDDDQLKEVEAKYPVLTELLSNERLRDLLRNPYVLDQAITMPWPTDRPLPNNERGFRNRFWMEVIRAESYTSGGMPRRREEAFVEIALRRARALTLYAPRTDLDADVVEALRRDSLISLSEESDALAAPAHDVLEDWAILRWIDEQYAVHRKSLPDLAPVLGTYPAIRRAYRKWLEEVVQRDARTADNIFESVVTNRTLPAHFSDDTLVSLLRSSHAADLLRRHQATLFRNGKRLLRRVIHLLRVGCVTAPDWVGASPAYASVFYVPDGPAWACVLDLVASRLEEFSGEEWSLLLGFVEDWARGVSWQSSCPEGAEAAAAIAHHLLPPFDDYRSKEQRKRTLQVIAKIPNAEREQFSALLRGNPKKDGKDRLAKELREVIFEGMESMPACRDIPELVIDVAKEHLLVKERDLEKPWGFQGSPIIEPFFGIKKSRCSGFFPASAIRGLFLPLLRYHAKHGLDFVISIFNHSAEWYAHPRVHFEYVEPPFEINLEFADGTLHRQWCNSRLWNLYRGTTVGPYVLQTALMALEQWLFEIAEDQPDQLDAIFLQILRRSESAALTAVVASVATAHPHRAGETLLVLLRTRECFLLDRVRLVHESQRPSILFSMMPQFDPSKKIYEGERRQSDERPHRQSDLETAIVNLQLGPLAGRVLEILDSHRGQLSPIEEQGEDDRVWRLALHRMDLRQYSVAPEDVEESFAHEDSQVEESNGDKRQRMFLRLDVPEVDLQDMVEREGPRFDAMNARLGLLMWGIKMFGRVESHTCDPEKWRERLAEARAQMDGDQRQVEEELEKGGPAFVAAVCARDHWEELSEDERNWCVETICSEVERDCDKWNHFDRVQRGSMCGDRPCAWMLPGLIARNFNDTLRRRVLNALPLAVTHAINEVRDYAASGVGHHLWSIDRKLTLRCVNALATESLAVQEELDAEVNEPYPECRELDEIAAEVAEVVRQQFSDADGLQDDAYRTFDSTRWIGAEASTRILTIFAGAPEETAAVEAFERLAIVLVEWWDSDDEARGRQRWERPDGIEPHLTSLLEHFLLRVKAEDAERILQPILDAIDRHPREVSWLLRGVIGGEDRCRNTPQFWHIWELFADRVRKASWLARIDDEHPHGGEMMSAVFLGNWWKDQVRHWDSLEGYADRVHALFDDLPRSSIVLDDYVRFLYHIGEKTMPGAFIRIAANLQQGDAAQMLRKGNTVFMLEALLRKYVYGKPAELKAYSNLRDSVLELLDTLVECGSSAAYRMRDDFVTPVPAT